MSSRRSNVQTFERSNVRTFSLAVKRLADIVLCLVVLLIAWPALVVIAVLVKVTSPGPVFFAQERVGRSEKVFRLVKFRSMTGLPLRGITAWSGAEEARITPVGRILRDYGLDELPQLWNILKGDMSIVGPRPPLPAQVVDYTPRQRKMFQMRPGVLSLAAIKGRRTLPVEQRLDLHVRYVEEWSLRLDFVILWGALFVVLGRQGASETMIEPDPRLEEKEAVQ